MLYTIARHQLFICHQVHVWNERLHKKTYIPKNMNLHMYYITQLNHNGSGRNKMTCNFANMTILLSGTTIFLAKFISYLLNCRYSTDFTGFSVQGVQSLGGHFACLCRGFVFYEVKRKWKYFYSFNHFYSEKSSKRAK